MTAGRNQARRRKDSLLKRLDARRAKALHADIKQLDQHIAACVDADAHGRKDRGGHNPALQAFRDRLRDAGKKPKNAIVAVMRKMITILNSIPETTSNGKIAQPDKTVALPNQQRVDHAPGTT